MPADVLDWPSVQDPEPELCKFCEATPDEQHKPDCFLYEPSFDELCQCDRCGVEFFSNCLCDAHCPEDER